MKPFRLAQCAPLLLLLLLAACTSGTTAQATPTPTPGITPTEPIPNITPQEVHFSTQDHVQLAGLLFGHGKTAVICSHESNTTKAIWAPTGLPQRLTQLGYMVLAYDFRGYGESAKGGTLNYDADTKAAMDFARQQGATSIILLGASMGGSISLKVAATESVAAVMSLSAPEHFIIMPLSDSDLQAIKAPKLFVNSEDDTYSDDTKNMYALASEPKQIQLYSGGAHGVAIFSGPHSASLTQLILSFLAQYAPAS
jgi:alpha-beta hydrolase superfamily lysophospholipase